MPSQLFLGVCGAAQMAKRHRPHFWLLLVTNASKACVRISLRRSLINGSRSTGISLTRALRGREVRWAGIGKPENLNYPNFQLGCFIYTSYTGTCRLAPLHDIRSSFEISHSAVYFACCLLPAASLPVCLLIPAPRGLCQNP